MKTILLTMFSPFAARHILRPDFIDVVTGGTTTRVVLVVPHHKKEFYQRTITHPRIVIEGVEPWQNPATRLDGFFFRLSLHYIETVTNKIMRQTWGKDRGLGACLISQPLRFLFNHVPGLRRLARWFDYRLVIDKRPHAYLTRYRPDLVIATHPIYFQEQAFIREAKRRGIRTLSIVNSWDNLSVYKGVMRIIPDRLLVPNEIVFAEARRWCDLRPAQLEIIGMWNTDYLVQLRPSPRADFCRQVGLDPERPFIVFASIGKNYTDTEWQDVRLIQRAIQEGKLPTGLQILIRSHPDPSSPFERGGLTDIGNLAFQAASTVMPGPTPATETYEVTAADDQRAFDAIYHSAVVVTIQSTISIEASVLDKPVINIAFDGEEVRPFVHPKGVVRYHAFTHYQPIHESGGVVLARTPGALITALQTYLADPARERAGRRRLVERLCWRADGQTLERLARAIRREL